MQRKFQHKMGMLYFMLQIGKNNFGLIRYDYYKDRGIEREAFKSGEIDFFSENSSKEWAISFDIDALRVIASGINKLSQPNSATVLITHNQRLLNEITPDFVHIMADGKIISNIVRENLS